MIVAPINLISLDERGIAYIAGTRMKVAEIARESAGLGYTSEEILDSHPHLTLAQVYAALSYYHIHSEKIDAYLREQDDYYLGFCSRTEQQISRKDLEERRARLEESRDNEIGTAVRVKEEGAQYS